MRRYKAYKDSGVEWIGEIPSHWKMVINGMLFHEEIRKPEIQDMPLSLSQKSGVVFADELDVKTLRTSSYENWKRVIENDLVLNRFKAHLGVLFASSLKGMVSFHYGVFAPRIKLLPKYYEYLFHTEKYKYKYAASSKGMTVGLQNLSNQDFYAVKSIFPPYEEQQAIVDYLKDKTLKIEQYVSARERERELLDSLKQSEIANVVTRGLNPNVKMKDSGIPWIGEIPEHWTTRKIKFLFKERSEKGYPNEPVLCATQKYGVIPQSMYENRVVVVNKGLEGLKLVKEGDFVISLRSFQGGIEYAHYQGIISAAYTVLSPSDEVNTNYIKYLFKSHPFIELLKTCVTGIREGQNINFDLLRKSSIMLPPLSEQQAIVSYIDEKLQKIDQYMADLQREIDYLKEFKQRLISDAVTGQLCITKQ